jgi:hypothetical protein
MTAKSRWTRADMQMWAKTSIQRLQHPFFRNTDPNMHRALELTGECEWKQGVSAAEADLARSTSTDGASMADDSGRMAIGQQAARRSGSSSIAAKG